VPDVVNTCTSIEVLLPMTPSPSMVRTWETVRSCSFAVEPVLLPLSVLAGACASIAFVTLLFAGVLLPSANRIDMNQAPWPGVNSKAEAVLPITQDPAGSSKVSTLVGSIPIVRACGVPATGAVHVTALVGPQEKYCAVAAVLRTRYVVAPPGSPTTLNCTAVVAMTYVEPIGLNTVSIDITCSSLAYP
jgi:hypothetical protein